MRYAALALLLLSGCTEYWVRAETSNATASADLADCRRGAGNMAVMYQVESPCMQGKGYHLSSTPQ